MSSLKDLSISLLIDIYGSLLSDKQLRIVNDYYNEDLSLSEISDNEGMSRQAVHETVKKSEQILLSFEEKLKLKLFVDGLRIARLNNDVDKIYELIDNF